MSDVMIEKQEKKRAGFFRRGCGRLARVLFQCITPCCRVGRRRRGRGDAVKGVTPIGDADGSRDEGLAAVVTAVDQLVDDGENRVSIGNHTITSELSFFPSTTILRCYICNKRVLQVVYKGHNKHKC